MAPCPTVETLEPVQRVDEQQQSRTRLALHVNPVGDSTADFGARRVAALLAEGRSVREIAAVTGCTAGYVRLLPKRIYKKQDVSGQVALVPRVLAIDALPRV